MLSETIFCIYIPGLSSLSKGLSGPDMSLSNPEDGLEIGGGLPWSEFGGDGNSVPGIISIEPDSNNTFTSEMDKMVRCYILQSYHIRQSLNLSNRKFWILSTHSWLLEFWKREAELFHY